MPALWELFVKVSGDNSSYKKSIRESGSDTEQFGSVVDRITGLASAAWSKLGVTMSAAGIGAVILNTGKDFQNASAQISRATGDTGNSLASLNDSLTHVYAGSAQSLEQISGGLSKLHIETKLTGDALETLTGANLRFAKVTGSDVKGAVEETQTVFKQWGIASADQADALDVLYGVMTETGIGLGTLSGQLASIGPVARSFGMSFVETVALVGSFEEAGIAATDVARGLQMAFAKWAAAGKDPKQALSELIENMRTAATAADAVALAIDAGFVKGASIKMADAARRGALQIGEMTDKLTESKGKVKDVADASVTLGEELSKMGHEAKLVAGEFGGPLVSALTVMLTKVRELNDEFAKGEQGMIDWLTRVPGIGHAIILTKAIASGANNLINPFASGNYANNYMNPGGPAMPRAPLPESLVIPGLGGGGGGAGVGTGAGKEKPIKPDDFKSLPFAEKSADAAVLVERINQLRSSISQTVSEIAKSGLTVDEYWTKKFADAKRGMDSIAESTPPVVSGFGLTAEAAAGAAKFMEGVTASILKADKAALDTQPWGQLENAMHSLGLTSARDLQEIAKEAKKNYDIVVDSGVGTAGDIERAWIAMSRAQIEADRASGLVTEEEYEKRKQQLEDLEGKHKQSTERRMKYERTLGEQVQELNARMWNNLERGLAQSVVSLKGWKDMGLGVIKDFATGGLEIMFKAFFKPLEDKMASVLGGIFGGGASAAGSAAGAGTSAAGVGASAAGAGASTGLMGILNTAFSGISAAMSVVGMFQNMHQETSLNAIELNTRRCGIFLGEGSESIHAFTKGAWQTLMELKDYMWKVQAEYLRQINDTVTWGKTPSGGGGGGNGITFNNCTFNGSDPNSMAAALAKAGLAGAI